LDDADMTSPDRMSRRMATLFGVVLMLIGWQATRLRPLLPPPFTSVLAPGEQVFPVAVPPGGAPALPEEPPARRALLAERSVAWGAAPSPAAECDLFVRISRHHWAHLPLSRARARELGAPDPGGRPARTLCCIAPGDLFNDRDGDGDPLDPGELATAAAGVEAELFCG
jgi:hypothetical protein